MQQKNDSFVATDGIKIHTVAWTPDIPVKANVLLVHGVAEHSARYQHVAEFLTARGYAVYSLDHRGHGQSDGDRSYFESFTHPVDDLKQYLNRIDLKGKPLFVIGHSMGTIISMAFVLRYQQQITGLVLSATPIALAQSPAALRVVVGLLDRIMPRTPFVKLSSDHISRDPAVKQKYDSDPLNYRGQLQVHMVLGLVQESRRLSAALHQLKLPILILHGTADQIAKPEGSQQVYSAIGSQDKTIKTYDGLYHEIFNEPEQDSVLGDVAAWLDKHIP